MRVRHRHDHSEVDVNVNIPKEDIKEVTDKITDSVIKIVAVTTVAYILKSHLSSKGE